MTNDETYDKYNTILDSISETPSVNLPMLWMWDTIRNVFEEIDAGQSTWGDVQVPTGVDLKQVWDAFYAKPWGGVDVEEYDVLEWLVGQELVTEWDEEEENG